MNPPTTTIKVPPLEKMAAVTFRNPNMTYLGARAVEIDRSIVVAKAGLISDAIVAILKFCTP